MRTSRRSNQLYTENVDLKRQLNDLVKQNHGLNDAIVKRNQLITELADALVSQDRPFTRPYLREDHELIQRAREAANA
jgi:hypothetical protein